MAKSTYENMCLSINENKHDATTCWDFEKEICNVAKETCVDRSWGSLIHLFAAASVIESDIWSAYPETNKAIRPLFNGLIQPRAKRISEKLTILWSREGGFDNEKGVPYQPNHFVPLLDNTLDGIPVEVWKLFDTELEDEDFDKKEQIDTKSSNKERKDVDPTNAEAPTVEVKQGGETTNAETPAMEVNQDGDNVSTETLAVEVKQDGDTTSVETPAVEVKQDGDTTSVETPAVEVKQDSDTTSEETPAVEINEDGDTTRAEKPAFKVKENHNTNECINKVEMEAFSNDECYSTSDEMSLADLKRSQGFSTSHNPPLCQMKKEKEKYTSVDQPGVEIKQDGDTTSVETPAADLKQDGNTTSEETPAVEINEDGDMTRAENQSFKVKENDNTNECINKVEMKAFSNDECYSTNDEMSLADLKRNQGFSTSHNPPLCQMNKEKEKYTTSSKVIKEPEATSSKRDGASSDFNQVPSTSKAGVAKNIGKNRSNQWKQKKKVSTLSKKLKKRKSIEKNESKIPERDTGSESETESEEEENESDIDLGSECESNKSSSSTDDEDESEPDERNVIKWSTRVTNTKDLPFCGPKPGSTCTISPTCSPLDYFHLIFPENIYDLMAQSTNDYLPIYREQRRKKEPEWEDNNWRPVSSIDIKAFIGLRMIMALDPKPSIEDNWSINDALRNQFISNTMSRSAFKQITRYFHVNDPTKDPTRMKVSDAKKAAVKKKDPLYKVYPLMEQIRRNSLKYYNLHREIAIDEAMVKCHGQHWGIVGAPNKPAKRGFKIFMMADSVTGYTFNFQVYLRSQNEIGLTQKVVENLAEDIEGFNHVIFVDKIYSSVPLALSLLSKKIYMVGSFNTNRRFWPNDLKINKRVNKKNDKVRSLKRGEYMLRQSTCGKLTASVWKDSKLVYNLSSCYESQVNQRRDTITGKIRNQDGKWKEMEFPCPPSIVQFNKFMGAVDRHDHLRSSYTLQRQSAKWWTYFAWFAVDMALINSYVIYKETHPKCTHKKFQLKVATELVGGYCQRQRIPKQRDPIGLQDSEIHNHECVNIEGRRARICRYCKLSGNKTQKGRVRETTYGCLQCNVNLHRDCFLLYHTQMTSKPTKMDAQTQTSETEFDNQETTKSGQDRKTTRPCGSPSGKKRKNTYKMFTKEEDKEVLIEDYLNMTRIVLHGNYYIASFSVPKKS